MQIGNGLQNVLIISPFIMLLLCLAFLPQIVPRFWESNRNKALLCLIFAFPVAIFIMYSNPYSLASTALDYAAFISLLAALFTISGGLYVNGSFKGHPSVNSAFLFIGAVLANIIGTTGASMLLIRPMLRANDFRKHKSHIVIFFIFIVSNCAGLLSPLGDPPLFLGFLRGVPFHWTLQLWQHWIFIVGSLLLIFFFVDKYFFAKEVGIQTAMVPSQITNPKFELQGGKNLILLGAIIALILWSAHSIYPLHGTPIIQEPFGSVMSKFLQFLGFLLIAIISYFFTRKETTYEKNKFKFAPIVEVAILFAGIFITMTPALSYIENHGKNWGITDPWQFFWLTGFLSSFLDNAPTYLTYTALAKSTIGIKGPEIGTLVLHPQGNLLLTAVSCGAVLMGANTYIGNGPNFMVKAIAEHDGIKMPSFLRYMVWALLILVPLFVALTLIFF